MPSPKKCRYGKLCHYGPGLCRYSHSYLEEEADEARAAAAAAEAALEAELMRDLDMSDDEGYETDYHSAAQFSLDAEMTFSLELDQTDDIEQISQVLQVNLIKLDDSIATEDPDKSVDVASLQDIVFQWFEKYYSDPANAPSIALMSHSLSTCPVDIQDDLLGRLSYMPLVALKRTKWFNNIITDELFHRCVKTPAFTAEAHALLDEVETQGIGHLVGSDSEWIRFREEAIQAPGKVHRFRMLYRRRLSIMHQTLNFSSKRDYFHSLEDHLEELRQEVGLAAWPSWQLAGAKPQPMESMVQAQDRVLRVWMEKLRAALTDV